jgi:hypothetical protein
MTLERNVRTSMLLLCMHSMKTAGKTGDVDDVSHGFMSVCEKSVFVKPEAKRVSTRTSTML